MSDNSIAVSESQQSDIIPDDMTMFGLLSGVIVRPRQTFTTLRDTERSYWWLVFGITAVALALLAFASSSAQSQSMQGFTPPEGMVMPEGMEGMEGMDMGAATSTGSQSVVLTLAVNVVGVMVGYLLCAFVVFALSFIFGGRVTFKQMFRMVVWTTLPIAIRSLIQAIACLIAGAAPVSGLSAVMTTMESSNMPTLSLLLGHVDIYLVWSMVLLAIGVSATTKLSKGKGVLIVLLYLLLSAATLIGWSAISQAVSELLGDNISLGMGGPGMGGGGRR